MNTQNLRNLLAAAALAAVTLGPAAGVALAEKPKATPPEQAQASRYGRGDERGRSQGEERGRRDAWRDDDRGRGDDRRNQDRGRGHDGGQVDRGRGSDRDWSDANRSRYARDDRSHDRYRDGDRRYDDRRYDDRRYDYRDHVRTVDRRDYRYYDTRWSHRRYYPQRGYYYASPPRGAIIVHHHHHRYYYGGGVWYAPRGLGWVVIGPPIGVFVSLLPQFYTTVWFGGIPYYYANDAYYVWRERERAYEVVDPPYGAQATTVSPAVEDIYVYPRQGQSQEQTDFDRYECHRWAVDETGFDPTQPAGGVGADRARAARGEYLRAMTACLEGRGYSVQ